MSIDRYTRVREEIAQAGELVGVTQMAEEWGVSVQRVHQIIQKPTFPPPCPGLVANSEAWLRDEVNEWRAQQRAG